MNETNNYNHGRQLEILLNRAFHFDKRIQRPHHMELQNLISVENGGTTRFAGTFEKQLERIKQRLHRAFELFVENEQNKSNIPELLKLKSEIDDLANSYDIIEFVRKGEECTRETFVGLTV